MTTLATINDLLYLGAQPKTIGIVEQDSSGLLSVTMGKIYARLMGKNFRLKIKTFTFEILIYNILQTKHATSYIARNALFLHSVRNFLDFWIFSLQNAPSAVQ